MTLSPALAHRSRRVLEGGLLAVGLLLVCACHQRPKAPALIDEPVYQNKEEGFRFLVPEGWSMAGRSDLPSGNAEKERLLVQYRRTHSGPPALLEVSRMDLPEETDLAGYLGGPSFSAKHWKSEGPPETVECGGAKGKRFRLTASANGSAWVKEVTTFWRGGRVYLFTALFSPKDDTAPEQVRRAIRHLVWTK
jgi:hypothetical protein